MILLKPGQQRTSRGREDVREPVRREPQVCARDRHEYRVARDRIEVAESVSEEARDTAGFGLAEHALELDRRVVLVDDDEAVEPGAPRVKEVAGPRGRERDV